MIIVNTGNGKGKTTAAVGQIVRSLGRGWKVAVIQLFKGREFYGEQKILKTLKNLDFFSFAPKHPFCCPEANPAAAKKQCEDALHKFRELTAGAKRYDLIVLEEFNIALRDNFLDCRDLLSALEATAPATTVILTGRGAPAALLERADLATEMKEIKHPYRKGAVARRGLEY
jgi:cob(I)alamin adenosyltransferase